MVSLWISGPLASLRAYRLFKQSLNAHLARSYFLLCGYTPFDRDSQYEEMQAICKGDYRFEPTEYWAGVSETARQFVRNCLTVDPTHRPTVDDLLNHPWLRDVEMSKGEPAEAKGVDLLPTVKAAFDAKKTCKLIECRLYRPELTPL